jgi:hypothetical protein
MYYAELQRPLSHFITTICALIGGVFVVIGLFDRSFWLMQSLFAIQALPLQSPAKWH